MRYLILFISMLACVRDSLSRGEAPIASHLQRRNWNMTTKQEVFNTVVRGLRKQDAPSIGATAPGLPDVQLGNGCAYRGKGGRRCAVGMLIPDDEYHVSMEGQNVALIAESSPTIHDIMVDVGEKFLCHLQNVHDDCMRVEGVFNDMVANSFRAIARDNGLEYPE